MCDFMKPYWTLLVAGILTGLQDRLPEDKIFRGKDFAKYVVDWAPIDRNKDGIPDNIIARYDGSGNGKPDVYAMFPIRYIDAVNRKFSIIDSATALGIDSDENGKMDELWMDTDGNYTLDSRELIGEENGKEKEKVN